MRNAKKKRTAKPVDVGVPAASAPRDVHTVSAQVKQNAVQAHRVRAVLWEWDPVGVRDAGTDWPRDEYDDLIEPILSTLAHDPDVHELADGLYEILTTDYGLPSPHGCHAAAALLLQLTTSPDSRTPA